jgi:hypothetical protein
MRICLKLVIASRRFLFASVFSLVALTCHGDQSKCEKLGSEAKEAGWFRPPYWGEVTGSGRAYFYTAPSGSCIEKKVFVKKGDSLIIYAGYPLYGAVTSGWMYVMYINTKTTEPEDPVEGWVRGNRIKLGGKMAP